ncbi:MAG: hypothetical protein Q9218_006002 [Villophora microphyllina]
MPPKADTPLYSALVRLGRLSPTAEVQQLPGYLIHLDFCNYRASEIKGSVVLHRARPSSPYPLLTASKTPKLWEFGMYIMFPIGWMYYFGTNLESRFTVPDFWPAPEKTHRIPFERDEMKAELERLKVQRQERKARKLKVMAQEIGREDGKS